MNWKEYYINIAEQVSKKSKDPSSKVGAIIVDSDNRIVSTGYNGFIAGCNEEKMSWQRPDKYFLVVHAEMNALIYAKKDLKDCKVFTTFGPCDNCLKHMLQAGIREIYYQDPAIMRDRSTSEQKEAIVRLIEATGAKVENVQTGQLYTEELNGTIEVSVKYAPFEGKFFVFRNNITLFAFVISEEDVVDNGVQPDDVQLTKIVGKKTEKLLREKFPTEKLSIKINL